MKIVLIGTGNIAWHIGQRLSEKNIPIYALYGRNIEKANELANNWNTKVYNRLDTIPNDGDVYLFTLNENAYEEILQKFPYHNKTMIHTSGSLPLSLFEKLTPFRGVLYPFQTCTKGCELQTNRLPLCLEASNENTLNTLKILATNISDEFYFLNSNQRKHLHLLGVFANNFSNAMYCIAFELAKKQHIDTQLLQPIIEETALKIQKVHPKQAQTGPAVRGNKNIQQKHLELLKEEDEIYSDIYQLISRFIPLEKV